MKDHNQLMEENKRIYNEIIALKKSDENLTYMIENNKAEIDKLKNIIIM